MVHLTVRVVMVDATLLAEEEPQVALEVVVVVQVLQILVVVVVEAVLRVVYLPALLVPLAGMLRLGLLAHRLPILTQLEQAAPADQTHTLVEQVGLV
jgi:hypothetical protein